MDARTKVMNATGEKIYEYFGNLVDERTKQPADDIITRFVAAEIDGDKLTRDDILDICFLFLIAGLDTVSDTLTCSYAFLATHPEHRQMIVDDPSIIPVAVEELLRWESPVAGGVPRMAQVPGRPAERRAGRRRAPRWCPTTAPPTWTRRPSATR